MDLFRRKKTQKRKDSSCLSCFSWHSSLAAFVCRVHWGNFVSYVDYNAKQGNQIRVRGIHGVECLRMRWDKFLWVMHKRTLLRPRWTHTNSFFMETIINDLILGLWVDFPVMWPCLKCSTYPKTHRYLKPLIQKECIKVNHYPKEAFSIRVLGCERIFRSESGISLNDKLLVTFWLCFPNNNIKKT